MSSRVGSPAKYRFEDRVLFFVVPLFFLDAILGIWGFHYHHLHPDGALAVVCAALQSSPIIAFIVIVGLYLAGETDDFQKTVLVQSILRGIGVTLAVTTFCGSLEKYGFLRQMDVSWVQILFFVTVTVSMLVSRWRYR